MTEHHLPTVHAHGVRCSCGDDFSPMHHNERGRLVPSLNVAWRRFYEHRGEKFPDRRVRPEGETMESVPLFDPSPYQS